VVIDDVAAARDAVQHLIVAGHRCIGQIAGRRTRHERYEGFRRALVEAAGELVICKEFGDDIADITQLAQQIFENGLLQAVALDPYGVGAIVDALYEVGISGQDTIVGINQGWKLSGAIKTAERKLADRTLVHGGQALMAWAVSNARVEPKGNAIVITKQASGTAKIDPLMAAFNAFAWMSANPATSQPSIFVI
jgi:phage terminase large subunit-like protein